MKTMQDAELKMLDQMAADFAAKELVEAREDHDRYPFLPLFEDVLAKAHEVGFFTLLLPEESGGGGQGITALCLILDDICRSDASLGGIIFTSAIAQEIITRAKGEALLTPAASGDHSYREALIAYPSFDNPGETGNLLEAKGKGKRCSLSGSIDYVVLAGLCSRALLPARIEGDDDYSFFLVNLSSPDVKISDPVFSLGLHACPACDLELSGVQADHVGQRGGGRTYFEAAADKMFLASMAMATGIMKGSFTEAFDYSRQRHQGGWEIVNWSEVRMLLASLAIKCKVADMMISEGCRAAESDEPGWSLGARAAAIHIQDLACDATTDGIQLLGGNGYMEDYGQEKRFRDAKQIQALLGLTPMKRLDYIRRIREGENPW
jgi:alkylation response protein AidB-like acyl-CoA dehydrogenase